MIAAGLEVFPNEEEQVKRFSSGIYTTIGSVGAIVMRFVSGGLADSQGFRESMDIQASMLLAFSVFYALFSVYWYKTSRNRANRWIGNNEGDEVEEKRLLKKEEDLVI